MVLRNECVPYNAGSRPIPATHNSTMRAYCRVDRCGDRCNRLGKRKADELRLARRIHSEIDSRVEAVISNCTGRRVFCCMIIARDPTRPPFETSDTRSLSKSQARSLLSIARLNNARSRCRLSICRRIRIVHISRSFSGGFCPTSLPLFHGTCFGLYLSSAT